MRLLRAEPGLYLWRGFGHPAWPFTSVRPSGTLHAFILKKGLDIGWKHQKACGRVCQQLQLSGLVELVEGCAHRPAHESEMDEFMPIMT